MTKAGEVLMNEPRRSLMDLGWYSVLTDNKLLAKLLGEIFPEYHTFTKEELEWLDEVRCAAFNLVNVIEKILETAKEE